MAWSNVGPIVTLEPGAAVTWEYSWDKREDKGLQIAGPHTGDFASPGNLGTGVASDQGKRVEGIHQVTYVVKIRNVDTSSKFRHNLAGGGLE